MDPRPPIPKTKGRYVRLVDLCTLLHNVRLGALVPSVGFEDADQTINQLCRQLQRNVWVPDSALESALWSSNLLNEQGKFWDAKERTFDQLVNELTRPGERFNRTFNCFERRKKD